MGFWKRISNAITQDRWDKYVKEFVTGADLDKEPTINASGNNALKFSAVFACCRVLAETFASVPIFEYKKIDDKTREKTDDTGLYDILHNVPNDEMSAYNFKEMAQYQINLGGNFVAKRKKNRIGELQELYPVEHERVSFNREKESRKRVTYTIDNGAGIDKSTLYRKDVFHVPGPSLNGIIGMSPIEYSVKAILLGLTYEHFGNKFYKNGAFPSGVFKHPGVLKDDAYKHLKADLEEKWQGLLNVGKPILAEDGLDFVKFDIKPVDAQLIECKYFQIEDICRFFRVQPHLIQHLLRSTNNNIEHQSLEFVMYTMLPHFKRWEECVNSQLLTKDQRKKGYYFEFNVASLLRGDQKSMAEAFAIGRQWGWLSVNDIRRLLNMNPIENGDIYLQPMNMIEAGTQTDDGGLSVNQHILDKIYALIEESKGA